MNNETSPTYADLKFTPFVQALISSFASRPHQWDLWEILQIVQLQSHATDQGTLNKVEILTSYVELRLHSPLFKNSPQSFKADTQTSASNFLIHIFSPQARPIPLQSPLLAKLEDTQINVFWDGTRPLTLQNLDAPLPLMATWDISDSLIMTPSPVQGKVFSDIRYCNSFGKLSHLVL